MKHQNSYLPADNLPGMDSENRAGEIWVRALRSANKVRYNNARKRAEAALEEMKSIIEKMNSK